jgi:hypothetical protein
MRPRVRFKGHRPVLVNDHAGDVVDYITKGKRFVDGPSVRFRAYARKARIMVMQPVLR